MRIAIVGPTHPYKGGVAQHTTSLAHRLAALGPDVDLESWSAQYPRLLYPGQQRVDAPEGPPYPRTRYRLSWRRPDGWWRLGRRLAGTDAVVLTLVTPVQVPAYLAIVRATRRRAAHRPGAGTARPRVLVVCHNVLPHEARRYDRALVRALLRRADAVLTHSPEQADLARSLTDAPVEVAALPPHLPASGTSAADPVPSPDPKRALLFFGLVRPYKGLDVLLRALVAVPDVTLTVAGEFWGGTRDVEKLIAELGLGARVWLRPGYVPAEQIADLFAAADALVLPYRSATASQNPDLAFAHGVPVVVSGVGALAERVRDGVDGLVVPPGDVEALAAALRSLYENDRLALLRAAVAAPDVETPWRPYLDKLGALLALPATPSPQA